MKKYNNWGIDMDGLSMTDPVKYRKINYVLNDKGTTKEDFLDKVETVPLEYAYDLADTGPTAENEVSAKQLKSTITEVLATLTAREERVLRMRFGIDLPTDFELEEVGLVVEKVVDIVKTNETIQPFGSLAPTGILGTLFLEGRLTSVFDFKQILTHLESAKGVA